MTIPLPRLSAPELRRKLLRLEFVALLRKGEHYYVAECIVPHPTILVIMELEPAGAQA